MKKKILGIFVCTLLLLPMLSLAEASTINDDVEIKISAGRFGRDIGLNLRIDVVNNKNESVTVYMNWSKDLLIRNFMDRNYSWKNTVPANSTKSFIIVMSFNDGIFRISFTAESGNTKVTRKGMCICKLVILFK